MTYTTIHCVFPQPGADITVLPEAWRIKAGEILASYRQEGPTHQGCCCGTHELLPQDRVESLKGAGFLVEEDSW